jgi:hypothetical protein
MQLMLYYVICFSHFAVDTGVIFFLLRGLMRVREKVGKPSWRPGYIVLQWNFFVVPHVVPLDTAIIVILCLMCA